MKLSDLAFACHVYSHMSDDYDRSYMRLLSAIQPELDFHSVGHMTALLKWLNEWGCRQFATAYHEKAAQELGEWYKEVGHLIFATDKSLLAFTQQDFLVVEQLYSPLLSKTASIRTVKNGSSVPAHVGPTGASKILFAWRPQAFVPWDEAMRTDGNFDGLAQSYSAYLLKTQEHLLELSQECRSAGFEIVNLPAVLGRPHSSLTKLMDEYSWVTITRKCLSPDREVLNRWASWS